MSIQAVELVNGMTLIYTEAAGISGNPAWKAVVSLRTVQTQHGLQPLIQPWPNFSAFDMNELRDPISEDKIMATFIPAKEVVSMYLGAIKDLDDARRAAETGIVTPGSAAGQAVAQHLHSAKRKTH